MSTPEQPTQPQPQQPALAAPQQPGPVQYGPYQAVYAIKPPTTPLAVTALILGIAGLVFVWVPWLPVLLGIAALVLGVLGMRKVAASPTPLGGKGLAIAGIVCGSAAIVGGVIGIVILAALAASVNEIVQNSQTP
ncbi:DUF4190 domain-containing protein [Salana multivorans]